MEITTIVGIMIAIVVIIIGLRLVLKKPADAAPSLDTDLHINPESQKPIIPRHVRDQLQSTELPQVEVAPTQTSPSSEESADVKSSVEEQVIEAPVEQKAPEKPVTEAVLEPKKNPELTLNSNIETAEIADFEDESSLLDSHLHEQQRMDEESALATAEEFIALNVFPDHRLLSGEKTLKVLMKYGLRYGEMACFHRYSEDNDKLLFSVLQITDDGAAGFDLESLSTEQVKGLAFFLALPHSDVQNAFDTMDSISRLIAREIDGTVYDQNHQEFTPQLREHWRHQAIDYRSGKETAL